MKSYRFKAECPNNVGTSLSDVHRPSKYRGRATDLDGEWVEGFYVCTDDNKNDPFRSRPLKRNHRIVSYYSMDWNMGGWSDTGVIGSTVCEWTGLQDKNGVDIYENDIITLRNRETGKLETCLVTFGGGMFLGGHASLLSCMRSNDVFVTGNVFDHMRSDLAYDFRYTKLLKLAKDMTSTFINENQALIMKEFLGYVAGIPSLEQFCFFNRNTNKLSLTLFDASKKTYHFSIILDSEKCHGEFNSDLVWEGDDVETFIQNTPGSIEINYTH